MRLATMADLEAVYQLALQAPAGLTTLPADRHRLKLRLEESVKNCAFPPEKAGGESFFFVLEVDNKIVGTSAVFTKVGGFKPFWTYEIKDEVKKSANLGIETHTRYLQVKKEHDGPSEIGTLFLLPEYRCHNHGRLLSLGRFLFMAQFPHFFEDSVLAEMRGQVDAEGHSLFWDAIGSHFFKIAFNKADLMTNEDKSFIDELMPTHPIYIPMLNPEVQEVIGKVHPNTAPALHILQKEGFELINEVDIFEGGPVVMSPLKRIRCVRESRLMKVKSQDSQNVANFDHYLLAKCDSLKSFSLTVALADLSAGEIGLSDETKKILNVANGAQLRVAPLFSGGPK